MKCKCKKCKYKERIKNKFIDGRKVYAQCNNPTTMDYVFEDALIKECTGYRRRTVFHKLWKRIMVYWNVVYEF